MQRNYEKNRGTIKMNDWLFFCWGMFHGFLIGIVIGRLFQLKKQGSSRLTQLVPINNNKEEDLK